MIKLCSVAEMQALEKEANNKGLSYERMMENAGEGIAKEIQLAYSHLTNNKIIALVGSGNNGGDALVALSLLATQNWNTCAYIVRKRAADDPLLLRLRSIGGQIVDLENDVKYIQLTELLNSCSVLIDGVLGTGIKLT